MSGIYVPGAGSLNARLMIVGQAPSDGEEKALTPFVGPSGIMLNQLLAESGITRDEVYVTNVVKYRLPQNKIENLHLIGLNLETCIKELWDNEIRAINPNCILALGNDALYATTGFDGILTYRGSVLPSNDGTAPKVVPSIHPAALFPRKGVEDGLPYVYRNLLLRDIKKAVYQSTFSKYNLPDRHLDIATSVLDVIRFFREYPIGNPAVDIESINCVPVCIGFAFNKHHALSIPLLSKIGSVRLTEMGYAELEECWRVVGKMLQKYAIVGHNLDYDDFKCDLVGLPFGSIHSDTLTKTRIIFPELPTKKLQTICSLFTDEPYYKEEGKEFQLGKHPVERLFKYNGKDCCVTKEADDNMEGELDRLGTLTSTDLRSFYYNFEMKKHKFYRRLSNFGFRADTVRQKELLESYNALYAERHIKLEKLVGHEINTKSTPQMYMLLYKELKFPGSGGADEDTIVRLLGNHCKGPTGNAKREILLAILEDRAVRDQLSKDINAVPDYDGRFKCVYKITGTETGRTSSGQLKKPYRPKKIGKPFQTIAKHGKLGKDIRSMYCADPGFILIQMDASQAEPRIVSVLSEDWDLLKAFNGGKVDIHRRTAGLMFGMLKTMDLSEGLIERVDTLEKDGPERFTGKTMRNAGNYDMEKGTCMEQFNTAAQKSGIDMQISEWKAGELLRLFHEATPKIKDVFHRQIFEAVYNLGYLVTPFGRVREFYGDKQVKKTYKEAYANIPQGTVADLVQGAGILALEEYGDDTKINFVSENHDALVMQAPINEWESYARVLKKHMERPIDFSVNCTLSRDVRLVIPCDVEISDTNWAALKKVKLVA